MLLCEAAGFDVVLVETVGVGQGETAVADMVDFFLVLVLPGAGDELQGIKKGVLELADAIAVNKADGDGATRAQASRSAICARRCATCRAAARAGSRARSRSPGTPAPGSTSCGRSSKSTTRLLAASGELATLRAEQQRIWMWSLIRERLEARFRDHPAVAARLPGLERPSKRVRRRRPRPPTSSSRCSRPAAPRLSARAGWSTG